MIERKHRVGIETLKLLVEVAWADREIAEAETDYLLAMAEQAGASDAERTELRRELRDQGRLPAPDISLLREYRDQVLREVDQLIAVDHRIVDDELAARAAVRRLLDGPQRPEYARALFGELDLDGISGRVAALAGLTHSTELERAVDATLGVVAGYQGESEFDFDRFVRQVSVAEGVAPGFALEHAQVILSVVGESLTLEDRGRLQARLPEAMAPLFEPPVREPGLPRFVAPRRGRPLATARPGSTHPISEAHPDRAQSQSIARRAAPHAERIASVTHGVENEDKISMWRPHRD